MAEQTYQPWTLSDLMWLRTEARLSASAFDLNTLANKVGRPPLDVNRALDALLGRAADEALAWLNRGGRPKPLLKASQQVTRFLAEVFGE